MGKNCFVSHQACHNLESVDSALLQMKLPSPTVDSMEQKPALHQQAMEIKLLFHGIHCTLDG